MLQAVVVMNDRYYRARHLFLVMVGPSPAVLLNAQLIIIITQRFDGR